MSRLDAALLAEIPDPTLLTFDDYRTDEEIDLSEFGIEEVSE